MARLAPTSVPHRVAAQGLPIYGQVLSLVHCDRIAAQPWPNHGGHTRELLTWPPGSGDDWALRISVADIDRGGPFSAWPGVDRWFAVVEGKGVVLRFGDARHVVDRDSPPLAFGGESAPHCDLVDGATRDLNLMVRRGYGHAQMQRAKVGLEHAGPSSWRALFAADAIALQIDDVDAARLTPFTLAFASHGQHQRWRIESDDDQARAWWIDFEAGAPK